jgi:hypothetical protein
LSVPGEATPPYTVGLLPDRGRRPTVEMFLAVNGFV